MTGFKSEPPRCIRAQRAGTEELEKSLLTQRLLQQSYQVNKDYSLLIGTPGYYDTYRRSFDLIALKTSPPQISRQQWLRARSVHGLFEVFWDFLGPPASTMSSSKLVGFFSANSFLHSLKSKLCAHKYSRITFPNRILLLRPQMQELQVLRAALRRRRYSSPPYSQTSDDYRSCYPGNPRRPCLDTHSAWITLT